ncbi:MAG: hypothetical protein ACTJG2_03030 [Candidatus Saccharimonadales bacterium]
MPNINIKRTWYHIKYRYPTREIAMAIGIALVIVWFIWGSVQAMQKNYELRRMVDSKQREVSLAELEMQMLEYEQRYLQSEEYKKLAVRQRLGYGDPGEKALMLPANTPQASRGDEPENTPAQTAQKPSNLSQWMNFLFGGNVQE